MVTGGYQTYDRSELHLLTFSQVLGQLKRWRGDPKCLREPRAREEAWSTSHTPAILWEADIVKGQPWNRK